MPVISLKSSNSECSVDSLLTLAELFECKVVSRHCEDFLRNAPTSNITSAKKILICNCFKLYGLLLDLVYEMSIVELQKLPLESFSPFLNSLMSQKFSLVVYNLLLFAA
ncbi:hypothetical protein L596_013207 [Steinernema carpocapsae]|uniref:BTB domain-containing protein n=1 Tax=Steinernema carpocapsae TaxID=34508 RepID=A0A4U5NZF4_STECR|nr:hypothetical protein L596_013207 [Steinernema carpocapsae]